MWSTRAPDGRGPRRPDRAQGLRPAPSPVDRLAARGADGCSTVLAGADGGTRAALLLRVQSHGGNGAAGRMLARCNDPSPAPQVRREGDDGALTIFRTLPAGGGFLTGTGRNTQAETVERDFHEVLDAADELDGVMGFLNWAEAASPPEPGVGRGDRAEAGRENARRERREAAWRGGDLHRGDPADAVPAPKAPERLDALTERERELLALIAEGLSNDELARRLIISPLTAKTHVSRILGKLRARDRAQLVLIAYETGLVPRQR